jgi:BirA family transcriptional regulator, biotin operon repressor / biotin---[acetyl-CoA-carboxylase] ligase
VTVVPEIVRLARVGSTMDVLHDLAQAGAPAGTAVVAEEQEAGRGSRGRGWSSPRGGLWLSVLARPGETGLELLSLRAGLALAAVLARAGAGDELRLKWPNDLMLGERKVGGILCEARWQGAAPAWVAIGVGLNVANRPPLELATTATHLAAACPGLTPEALTGPVVESLRMLDTGPGPLGASELQALERVDWLRGRPLTAPAAGRADGIAADGALRVRRPDGGVTTVRAGTVVLAHLPATAGR